MKAILVSDEHFEFLKSLSNQLKEENRKLTQQHATADPCFCVYHKKRHYADYTGSTDGDGTGWVIDDEFYLEDWNDSSLNEIIAEWKKDYPEDKNADKYEILETLKARHVYFVEYPVFVGAFLTDKAARNHIKQNRHHYKDPYVYVDSFWRNYEMQDLRVSLANMDFNVVEHEETEGE